MENSNVDFSYKDSSIGGFPFSWNISIKEPRIALISQSAAREISAEKAEFCFDYDLNSVSVSLPEAIEYNFNRAEAFYNYSLLSEDKVTAKVSFIDSLYKIPGDKKWTTNYIKTVFSCIKMGDRFFFLKRLFNVRNKTKEFTVYS